MKILYLCHRIPYPPNKGEKIRAFHQIQALSSRHEIDLLCLADDPTEMAYAANLEAHCRSVEVFPLRRAWKRLTSLPYLLSRKALSLPCFYSGDLAATARQRFAERRYDRIFVYCSVMGQYLAHAPAGIPVIADFVDVDSDKWLQYADFTPLPWAAVYRREGRCLRRFERQLAEVADCVLVTTDREAELLRSIAPAARIECVPNGVDTEFFRRPTAGARPDAVPTIVFTGDMSYFPNEQAVRWFADEILPRVAAEAGDVRFIIVGRNPGRNVRVLAERKGIEVTGYVRDVRHYLARAAVAVAPFQIAAGIQNKILEAMSYGAPVVATTRTAQGLRPRCRELAQLADDAQSFAARVTWLLREKAFAASLGAASRQSVVEEYSWEASIRKTLQVVENPVASGPVARDSDGQRIAPMGYS